MPNMNPIYLPTPLSFASVPIQSIAENCHRLDASAYNMDVLMAKAKVIKYLNGYKLLWGEDGLIKDAYYPGRYKRIYSNANNGVPFFLPSQLDEIYPKPSKYVSSKTASLLKKDLIKKGELLLSRSGTIGKCTIASKTSIGRLFSDDVIRITFKEDYDLGYVYAFFNTDAGLTLLQSNNYGAVIDHIEPEHLSHVLIPNAPIELRKRIHKLRMESFELRDKSNDLIDKAQELLCVELQLPKLSSITPQCYMPQVAFNNYAVKASQLNGRLDASYHIPLAAEVVRYVSANAKEVLTLGDYKLSKNIILAGVFKRTYVNKDQGVPFLGGRDILTLSPRVEKYLSKTVHHTRIQKELKVSENYILISDRGTIGKVQIVPKHWNDWAVSQNIIKVIPSNSNIAGYLYAYLSLDIISVLIKREIYGSVVDMIDDDNVASIPVPLLKNNSAQQQINDWVLEANDLRYQAYQKKSEALQLMEDILDDHNKCE